MDAERGEELPLDSLKLRYQRVQESLAEELKRDGTPGLGNAQGYGPRFPGPSTT